MVKHLYCCGDFFLTKVGYDANGNWSYWIRHYSKKRSQKIQHGDLDNGLMKLTTEILTDLTYNHDLDIARTVDAVIVYYRKHYLK